MGYNTVRTDPDDKTFERQEKLQYILLISNCLLLIVALANFSICIWIRYINNASKQIQIMTFQSSIH